MSPAEVVAIVLFLTIGVAPDVYRRYRRRTRLATLES